MPAATATAEPELDPPADRSSACGLTVSPPRPLHPLTDRLERKFAHSDMLADPATTIPAAISRSTTGALRSGRLSMSAREPAVETHPSTTSMLSLSSTGIPDSRPPAPDGRGAGDRARFEHRKHGSEPRPRTVQRFDQLLVGAHQVLGRGRAGAQRVGQHRGVGGAELIGIHRGHRAAAAGAADEAATSADLPKTFCAIQRS